MAGVNKNKHLENATKHVQRGQLDRAVKELQKILEHDPEDIPVRLKVAGLIARGEKPNGAMPHYDQVATHYVEKGFNARAVAVYELMVKIDPQRVDLHMKLGDLYAQLMRRADALREYQIVATWFDAKGKAAESLEVLRKMAEIGPDNARVRRKLAELMVQQNQPAEAIAELNRLAETLRRKNDLVELAEVLDRVAMLDPKSLPALRASAQVHLDRRDPRRALARLQTAFGIDAHDPDTLAMLADAFLALGNRGKTLAVLRELARVHERAGRNEKRDEVYREVLRHDPRDADALDALEPPIPLTEPSNVEPAKPLDYRGKADMAAPLPTGNVPIEKMTVARLLSEADIYVRYGIKAKAIEYLEAALEKDPQCLARNAKLSAFWDRVQSGDVSNPGAPIPRPPPPGKAGFVEVSVEVSQALEKMGGADFREELDEAEFFLRQQLYDEAIAIFRSLASRFPKEKEIREKLAAAERALDEERSASVPAAPAKVAVARIELKKVPASQVAKPGKREKERERELELDLGGVAEMSGSEEAPHHVSVAEVLHEMSGEIDLSTGKRSNFELGMSYVELGLVEEAMAAFERACADPDRAAEALQQIGLLKLERGDVEGALRSLKKAIDLAKPSRQPGIDGRAGGEEPIRQAASARKEAEGRLSAIEQSYGGALEAAGRYQEAAALYRRLLEAKNGKR